MIGAIGSWAGTIIGVVALIIALLAYIKPTRKRIKATFDLSSMTAHTGMTAMTYTITVCNLGVPTITISSVQLRVGDHSYLIEMMENRSFLKIVQPKFPVKLESGQSISMIIQKHRMDRLLGKEFIKQKEYIHDNVLILVRDATDREYCFPTNRRVYDFIHESDQGPLIDVFSDVF